MGCRRMNRVDMTTVIYPKYSNCLFVWGLRLMHEQCGRKRNFRPATDVDGTNTHRRQLWGEACSKVFQSPFFTKLFRDFRETLLRGFISSARCANGIRRAGRLSDFSNHRQQELEIGPISSSFSLNVPGKHTHTGADERFTSVICGFSSGSGILALIQSENFPDRRQRLRVLPASWACVRDRTMFA